MTVRRIDHAPLEEAAPMSSIRRKTLLSASRKEYFQVPRRVNQKDAFRMAVEPVIPV